MKKRFLNLALLGIALLLFLPVFVIGYLATIVHLISRWRDPQYIADHVSERCEQMAMSLDAMANVWGADFWNPVLRKPGGYAFGKWDELMSKVLGKNKHLGTETDAGRGLSNSLNWLDKEHVERAAGSLEPTAKAE